MRKNTNIVIIILVIINFIFNWYLLDNLRVLKQKIEKINDYIAYDEEMNSNRWFSLVWMPNESVVNDLWNNKKEWINMSLWFKITLPNDWFPASQIWWPASKRVIFDDQSGRIWRTFDWEIDWDNYSEISIWPLNFKEYFNQKENCKWRLTKDCFDEKGEYISTFYNYFNWELYISFNYDKNDSESVEIIESIRWL